MTERSITYMPVDDLPDAPRNPKGHDDEGIAASMERFGYVEPVVIDERTGWLVSGHGRKWNLLERRERGEPPPDGITENEDGRWLVPVVRGWASRDEAEAEAFVIAANRLTIKGGWENEAQLATMLDELRSLDLGLVGTGFDAGEVDRLLAAMIPPSPPEEFPELDPTAMKLAHSCPRCGYEWTGSSPGQ